MSTQYSVVNTRITEEVAEFQKKVSAIRAECLRMMREASVSADLQEIKEDLMTSFLTVRYSLLRNQKGHPL